MDGPISLYPIVKNRSPVCTFCLDATSAASSSMPMRPGRITPKLRAHPQPQRPVRIWLAAVRKPATPGAANVEFFVATTPFKVPETPGTNAQNDRAHSAA